MIYELRLRSGAVLHDILPVLKDAQGVRIVGGDRHLKIETSETTMQSLSKSLDRHVSVEVQ